MEFIKRQSRYLLCALAVPLIAALVGTFSGATAQDLPVIIDIRPVPDGPPLSPVVGEDGLYFAPRSGPLEALDDTFIVIADMRYRLASSIRFLRGRNGFSSDRSIFKSGAFVEYLLNDAREVTVVWPSAGS